MSKNKPILVLIGLTLALIAGASASQAESSMEPQVFECGPDDIPETTIIESAKNDVQRAILGDSYEERFPDECKSWTKSYEVNDRDYLVEIVKFEGEDDAVIMTERDGSPVRYANVGISGDAGVSNDSVGSTDGKGMIKTELPEEFVVYVSTRDGELNMEGQR